MKENDELIRHSQDRKEASYQEERQLEENVVLRKGRGRGRVTYSVATLSGNNNDVDLSTGNHDMERARSIKTLNPPLTTSLAPIEAQALPFRSSLPFPPHLSCTAILTRRIGTVLRIPLRIPRSQPSSPAATGYCLVEIVVLSCLQWPRSESDKRRPILFVRCCN